MPVYTFPYLKRSKPMIKILFFAPDPSNTARIKLGTELQAIQDRLDSNKFDLRSQWAVKPKDVLRTIMEVKPHIVHFSGHGLEDTGELCFEDEMGLAQPVGAEALATLFKLAAEYVKCVVINTCFSQKQADAIAEHIPFVVGMKKEISDRAAIVFASGFYTALESDQSIEKIEKAFESGCVAIQIEGILEEHKTPDLIFGDPRNRFRADVEQHKDQLQKKGDVAYTLYRRALLERGRKVGLSDEEIASIMNEVMANIEQYKLKLEDYKKTFKDAVNDEFPLEEETREAFKFLQFELGLKDEDVSMVQEEILSDPKLQTPESYFDRGLIQYSLGEYKKALAFFTEAIRLKPNYSGAYLERAATQAKLKNFKASIADNDAAIQINSSWDGRSLSTAHFERGYSYYDLALQENLEENMNAAIADWDKSIELRPQDSSSIYYNRALAYNALNKYEDAIQSYSKAIEVDNGWTTVSIVHAYYRRGLAYRELGNLAAANNDLGEIVKITRENPNFRFEHPDLAAILDFAELAYKGQTEPIDATSIN